jgi:hypothetical protein
LKCLLQSTAHFTSRTKNIEYCTKQSEKGKSST